MKMELREPDEWGGSNEISKKRAIIGRTTHENTRAAGLRTLRTYQDKFETTHKKKSYSKSLGERKRALTYDSGELPSINET